jgi:tetratricopeptide (TPR) repeat protein
MRANRSAEAVTLLEQAQTQYPENEEIRSQLLNAYVASGQEDRALDQYRQAVESDPNSKLFRYNYGSLLLQSERYDEAIEQLEAAIAIDPNYASAQYNLGAAYVNKAVDANDRIGELDDQLRQQRATLTAAQVQERESEMDALVEQRRQFFEAAVAPLERAQELMQAEGGEVMPICQALFQAYVQTGQQDKAETVSACAGYGAMNNQ